jgi:hypothetical protein
MYEYTQAYITNSVALVRKQTIPTERRRLSAKLVPTFTDRGCRVVSAMDPQARILGFLDRAGLYIYVNMCMYVFCYSPIYARVLDEGIMRVLQYT